MTEEGPDYFLDMYGTCDLGGKCNELKPGAMWLGRACEHWTPLGPRSHAELLEPVECEYHDDIPPAAIETIKKLANPPREDDPDWVVVYGPGW